MEVLKEPIGTDNDVTPEHCQEISQLARGGLIRGQHVRDLYVDFKSELSLNHTDLQVQTRIHNTLDTILLSDAVAVYYCNLQPYLTFTALVPIASILTELALFYWQTVQ